FNQGIVSDKEPALSTSISTVVLENVAILAIAQKLEGEDNRDNNQRFADSANLNGNQIQQQQQRSNPPVQPGAKTATMAVSSDDALKLSASFAKFARTRSSSVSKSPLPGRSNPLRH